MATDIFAGPVDYVVFAFDDRADIGPGLAALLERVDQGIVEILDLEAIAKTADGSAFRQPLGTLGGISGIDLSIFDGVDSHILDDADLAMVVADLAPGQFALVVVYEDRSLAAAAAAWSSVGGTELFSGGIDIGDLAFEQEEGNQS